MKFAPKNEEWPAVKNLEPPEGSEAVEIIADALTRHQVAHRTSSERLTRDRHAIRQ